MGCVSTTYEHQEIDKSFLFLFCWKDECSTRPLRPAVSWGGSGDLDDGKKKPVCANPNSSKVLPAVFTSLFTVPDLLSWLVVSLHSTPKCLAKV